MLANGKPLVNIRYFCYLSAIAIVELYLKIIFNYI